MSFRDTFTRDSTSGQNLQYDDAAAYHFYLTMLLLLVVPLIYSIIRSILNPFGHIPHLKKIEDRNQFKERIGKFKRDYRYSYMTKWFIFKVVIVCLACFAIYSSYVVLRDSEVQIKGFDPYEILNIDPDAPIEKIKKSYRKLALKYHPDRNQDDPQANARFIMITKAYQCLTDEDAKLNCLKYGNPEGSTSFNVGIALPSFLVKKENHVAIMGIVFLLVVIVIPIIVVYYQSQINKYDDQGMLLQNHMQIHASIHQQFGIREIVRVLPLCGEFVKLNGKKQGYQQLMKHSSDDVRTIIAKKKYLQFVNKGMLIIDARMAGQTIPSQLQQDQRLILKKTPMLVRAIVMVGLQRSTQEYRYTYQNQNVVGVNALVNVILFGQLFLQGLSDSAYPIQQLCLRQEEINKISRKKKKIPQLRDLIRNTQDRDAFLVLIPQERQSEIRQRLDYFPMVEMEAIVHAAGDHDLTSMDILEIIVSLKTNRQGSFCSAYQYPFLKEEGWYVIVSDGLTVLHLEHFNFEKLQYEIKFNRRPHQQTGSFTLSIRLLSDCYFGLDLEKEVKYHIKQAKKLAPQDHKDDQDYDSEGSLFSRWMSSVMPKEEEELSDQEDESPKEKSKAMKKEKEEDAECDDSQPRQMKREDQSDEALSEERQQQSETSNFNAAD